MTVAIGSGTPLMANDFKRDWKFEGDLFCDKERAVYKVRPSKTKKQTLSKLHSFKKSHQALGCNRGLKYVITGKVLDAVKGATKQGYSQGAIQGDSLQLGGVFLISRKQGLMQTKRFNRFFTR